ncbi:hypothetical protein GETHLI_02350 [Geothrix limicola]|uniref:Methyl-accepting chemotaxis protein n=1 Tax=Geothrix limicola TaxID=2927978 RepID=A0ABQ5QAV7_9BACT|nr:methyl-accepting chemotaxis protein [Geothrix limicola]GLH71733.1 hypothetical protein GETHLI_02350 [Geothrix limicola]
MIDLHSIKVRLLLTTSLVLLVTLGVSSFVYLTSTSDFVNKRIETSEMPAILGSIRHEVEQQIAGPLAVSRSVVSNPFLMDWAGGGESAGGLAIWKRYGEEMMRLNAADSITFIPMETGHYYSQVGLLKTMKRGNADSGWLYGFLDRGADFELNADADEHKPTEMMLYINARGRDAKGRLFVGGLGLSANRLAEQIRKVQVGQSGQAMLVRKDGTFLVHRDSALIAKKKLEDLPGLKAAAPGLLKETDFNFDRYPAADGTRLVASSFIPSLKSFVIVELPESEVLGPVHAMLAKLGLVMACMLVLALAVMVWIAGSIANPIGAIAASLERMSEGDLALDVSVTAQGGELKVLQTAMTRMVSKLAETIGQVSANAGKLVDASDQLSTTAQSLSQGASEQAASVEETSAAMEEMSASIAQNNENAKVTGGLATRTSTETVAGGRVVMETVGAMKQIAQKIAIIDEIAYQTNLLALNAAIEAGRAGEHGRGFAVVAAEVRKLAERSQVAAEEISQLAKGSVVLAEKAGTLLETIVPSIQKTSDLVQEISAASEEQNTGVNQISQAITQISQAIQHTAASSEELASTASELSAQAQELQTTMTFFQLPSELTRPSTRSPRRASASRPRF